MRTLLKRGFSQRSRMEVEPLAAARMLLGGNGGGRMGGNNDDALTHTYTPVCHFYEPIKVMEGRGNT